jgi:hypothetical protein
VDANAELSKLATDGSRAASRVSDLEAQWRQAVEASRVASAELAEVERQGGSATTRHKAEQALATAQERAAEPWAERVEGAKAAVRDVDKRYRAHIAAHLGELVEVVEAKGRIVAQRENTVAAELIAIHAEWGAVAAELGALMAQVARPSPGDVSYGRPEADEAARGAIALVNAGGQVGPVLDRTRPPWNAILGVEDEVVEVDDAVPQSVTA